MGKTNKLNIRKTAMSPRWVLLLLMGLLIILGLIYIYNVWVEACKETSEQALKIAKTAKAGFPQGAVKSLESSSNIILEPAYKDTKASLEELVKINKNVRFAYIFGRKNDVLYFIVDSEKVDSKDYSPPGQEYTEASESCKQPFKDGKAVVIGPQIDRWGTWFSALIPIEDNKTGEVFAVLGMDYPASTWNNFAVFQTIQAGVIVLIALLLLIAFYVLINKNLVLKNEKNKLNLANEKIEKAKKNFDNFFNTTNNLIFVINADKNIINVNDTVCKRLEYTKEELIGKSALMVQPKNRREEADKVISDMLAGEEKHGLVPCITKSGKEIQIEARGILGEWDEETALFVVLKDVSDIKKSEEKFSKAFHSGVNLMAISRAEDGCYIDVNDAFLNTLGYTREEVIGRTSVELNIFDTKEQRELMLQEVKTKGRANEVEVSITARDGSLHAEIFTADPIIIGDELCLLTSMTDITRRKEAEEALRESEERFRVLIENSHDIIYTLNAEGIFTFVSPAWTVLLGHPVDQVTGQSFVPFVNEEDVKSCLDFLYTVIETAQRQEGVEYRVKHTDGSWRWHTTSAVPSYDESGKVIGIIGIARDITRQKEDELELMRSKEKAEAANVAKSQFLANMSHEIRTPMNGVVGFLQLLQNTELNETQKEYVREGIYSSEVLLRIINDILDFSKIEAGKLTMEKINFNIRAAVEDAVSTLMPNAEEKGLLLYSFIKSNVPEEVVGDTGRLIQVLNNLLSNAIKFTQKGEIVVTAEVLEAVENIATISFKVSDTGVGISKDACNKLFKPFTQEDSSTTRKFGGTGLGLAISKELVNMMDGDIGVESAKGEGSTFFFTAKFEIVSKASEERTVQYKKLENTKVLIADDNKTNRDIIRSYLGEYGINVIESKNGKNTIEQLLEYSKNGKPIDIVICDYKIPDMSSYDLASEIKAIPLIRNTSLILLASIFQKRDAIKANEKTFQAYLSKPVKKDELINSIILVTDFKQKTDNDESITAEYTEESEKTNMPRILLAEDTAINRKVVVEILKNKGLTCDVAENGKEAYQACLSKNYDIIFMDCQMPVMDGYEAAAKIRDAEGMGKHTKIIAMTANAMEGDREKCIKAGMDDYISKPINFEIMLKMIEESTQYGKAYLDFIDKDMQIFAGNTGLAMEDVKEIFNDYIDSIPYMLKNIQDALESDDFGSLSRLSHQLKGSSGNLRINEIYQLTLKLEEFARNKDKSNCENVFLEIKNLFE